jgi:hypothetical protein
LVQSIDAFKQTAKDYVQKESDFDFKMSIERTSIRNLEEGTSFYFKVLSLGQVLYQSRKTIIAQPCWRDDVVSLKADASFTIEVNKTTY